MIKKQLISQNLYLFALFCVLIFGSILRLNHLNYPILWDEVLQYYPAVPPFNQIIGSLYPDNTPLSFFLGHFWFLVTDYTHDPFLLRLPVMLVGLLCVPVTYWFGLEISGNRWVSLLGALGVAVLPILVAMSQFYRMYSLLILLSLLSLVCLLQALRTNKIWLWVAFVIFTVLNLYNHYNALLATGEEVLFCGLWLVLNWLNSSFLKKSNRSNNKNEENNAEEWQKNLESNPALLQFNGQVLRQRVIALLVCFGVIFVLYLPWLPHLVTFFNTPGYGVNRTDFQVPSNFNPFYEFISRMGFGYNLGFWVGLFLGLIGLAVLLRQRFYYGLLAICYFVLMSVVLPLLPNGNGYYFVVNSRYDSFITPVYVLLVVQGLYSLSVYIYGFFQNFLKRRNLKLNKWLVVAISLVPAILLGTALLYQSLSLDKTSYTIPSGYASQTGINEAGAFLKNHLQPQDSLVTMINSENSQQYSSLLTFESMGLNFALLPGGRPVNLDHSYLILYDHALAKNDEQRLQTLKGRVWLTVFTPFNNLADSPTAQQIKTAADSRYSVNCFVEICVIGSSLSDAAQSEYQTFEAMLKTFAFLK